MQISKQVAQFYEEYPYPYLPIEKKEDLLGRMHSKTMENILGTARLRPWELDGKRVLDAGCGTGEKAAYFALLGADVYAFDRSRSSLLRAGEVAGRLDAHVKFKRGDILKINLAEEFDHVFSLGVLHHTENPKLGFENIAGAVKQGGTITIGLYNAYGRFFHCLERGIVASLGGKTPGERMDYVKKSIFGREFKSEHERAFAADKYAHPHESHHTLEEVMEWFEYSGFDFIGCYPEIDLLAAASQLRWLVQGKGFFIVSGRRLA